MAPRHLDGKLVFEMVKNIKVVFGKPPKPVQKRKKIGGSDKQTKKDEPIFKKQSIFYKYLPYWEDLDVCHAIDVMHVEKNGCYSILAILLDLPGTMKDGIKSHKDFVQLGIKLELHLQEREDGKLYLPPASYNLTTKEKRAICKCLRGVRVPTGYSSNIKNLVSMKDMKLVDSRRIVM